MEVRSMTFDCSYSFKYSINSTLTIKYINTGEYDEYEVLSDYGELMFHNFDFKKVVEFINDLLDDKYA